MWPVGLGDMNMPGSARAAHVAGGAVSREVVPPALWRLFVLVWLLFLYYPLLALFAARPTPFQLGMTLAGTALFVAIYLLLALPLPFGMDAPSRLSLRAHLAPLALAALLLADILLLALLASADWLWFVMFVSIALGARLPARPAVVAIAAMAALTVVVGVGVLGWVYALRIALPVVVVGLGMIGVGWLVATIRALRAAREEIARLAVGEERLRFARDLHDLLGHSLSAITLKNEVARSLLPAQPDRARRELDEAIGLAREALREVRQAVSGYRRPTLLAEIANARSLLDAAGVACTVKDTTEAAPLPPAVEAVLAWTVREGATNVVRHSGARHCAIALSRQAHAAAIEITDDGRGKGAVPPGARGHDHTGSGLRGLAERAAELQGRLEAGAREPVGFRLWVSIPLPAPKTEAVEGQAAHQTEEKATQA